MSIKPEPLHQTFCQKGRLLCARLGVAKSRLIFSVKNLLECCSQQKLIKIVVLVLIVSFSGAASAQSIDSSIKDDRFASPNANPQAKSLEQTFDSLNHFDRDALARIKFISDNEESLYARWRIIEDAKETIDCASFIVDKSIFGQAFLGLLARKAQQGVKVRLMVDGRMYRYRDMKGMPDKFQELAAFPNVQIKIYNSVFNSIRHAITDFKGLFAGNHAKILIGDGKMSIIGGRNIGASYFGEFGEFPVVFVDADIVMEGTDIASQLKMAFEGEWNSHRNSTVKPDIFNVVSQKDRLELADQVMTRYMNGKGLLNSEEATFSARRKRILQKLNDEISRYKSISAFDGYEMFSTEPRKRVKIIDKFSSLKKHNDITPSIEAFMDSAREEIIIQNPYVVLTGEAKAALKRAAARGVRIIIHTNSGDSTDAILAQAFFMNDWKQILVEIPTCQIFVAPSVKERLHSKIFIFDSQVTVVGSYNMDPISQNLFSEVAAVVDDVEFSTQARRKIEDDMKVALEYKIKIGPQGEIITIFGPENHLSASAMQRMKFFRKLKWIRPLTMNDETAPNS